MTLVYKREDKDIAGPRTHAFVIGCGRYVDYRPDGSANRRATVAGARTFARFLAEKADDFVAPIATIELLLSDPNQPSNASTFDFLPKYDPRRDTVVASATRSQTETAGLAWVKRCAAGDHMIFYFAGHGVLDSDRSAIGLLEEIGSIDLPEWAASINVTQIATALPTKRTAGCWVFFDACQEVVTDLIERRGAPGVVLMNPGIREVANVIVDAVALAGSRAGSQSWAPNDDQPPFFTQALLEGLRGACAEEVNQIGWAVTGKQLLFCLPQVADAALGYRKLLPQQLSLFNQDVPFLKILKPEVPVLVTTETEAHMLFALNVTAVDASGRCFERTAADKGLEWRFRVPADDARYVASATFPERIFPYQNGSFIGRPPAQRVVLKR